MKKEKSILLEDIKRLKQDKQALEVDLEKMRKERDQAKDQIAYATGKTELKHYLVYSELF